MAKHILLADDSITIQKVVELTLSDRYDVECVGNGVEALKHMESFRPDLLLCDASMPEKDGYEVCAEIRASESFAALPIVMLHGAFESFDEERAKEIGANAIVTKPFDSQALIETIEALLKKAESPKPEAAETEETSPPAPQEAAAVSDAVDAAFENLASETSAPELSSAEGALEGETPSSPTPESPSEQSEDALLGSSASEKESASLELPEPALNAADLDDDELHAEDFGGHDGATVSETDSPDEKESSDSASTAPSEEKSAEGFEGEETPPPTEEHVEESEEEKEEIPLPAPSETAESSEVAEPPSVESDDAMEESPASQEPSAYYEPPEGITESDKDFAREMLESSSVRSEEMLPEGVAPPSSEADAPVEAESENHGEAAISPEELLAVPPPETGEEMPTSELLKDLGPSTPSAPSLSEDDVDRLAERVVRKISEKLIREIAWEVVPDLAEVLIRKKIDEIEKNINS